MSRQAQACQLAYVKSPGLDAEYGMDAAHVLAQMLGNGRPMEMTIISSEKPTGGKNPLLGKPVLKV